MYDDIQRSIVFDKTAHRLRSHPKESVRREAERALRAKVAEGIDRAEEILKAIPEANEKTLVDTIIANSQIKTIAHAARAVREGRVRVNEKVATDSRQLVSAGDVIEVRSAVAGKQSDPPIRITVA